MSRPIKYHSEEERKAAKRERQRRWAKENPNYAFEYRKKNKDKIQKKHKEWIENHPEYESEYRSKYQPEYRSTKKGRAKHLLSLYKEKDKKYNRGECTLTSDWIVENIFTKSCHYCGETDWKKLGCDRLDNSKPHTADNVVCSCAECNVKKCRYSYDEYMKLIGKIK